MAKQDDIHNETTVEVETTVEQTADPTGMDDRIAELTDDLQRLQAEFQNFKRRTEQERAALLDYAKAKVVTDFLVVRDNFDRELTHRPADIDATWAASIDSIRIGFDTVLKGLGVERYDSVGADFDPHLHEAVSSDGSGAVVTTELQPGYKLGSTILRPAIVKAGDKP